MSETGHCPKCNELLDFFEWELESNSLSYEVACPKCGFEGYEVYSVEFTHFTDKDYKPVDVEYSECLGCEEKIPIDIETDIQLCQKCMKNYDMDKLWKLHDEKKLDALDFNEDSKMRERFRK